MKSIKLTIINAAAIVMLATLACYPQDPHYTYPFTVDCEDHLVMPGDEIECAVKFDPAADPSRLNPTWNWTVSGGTIVSGQGTNSIKVTPSAADAGVTIHVTAHREFPDPVFPGIQKEANDSFGVAALPQARMLEEFATAGSNCEYGLMLMDRFMVDLNNDPSAQGYIVIYSDAYHPGADKRVENRIRYTINRRRFDQSRITLVRGPVRKEAMTQLWIVPAGAQTPEMLPANAEPAPARKITEAFVWATDAQDGLPECAENLFDLNEYAELLNSDPSLRANVVINEVGSAKFRAKGREILSALRSRGISMSRVKTFFVKVPAGQLRDFTELWIVPSKR